MYKHILLPINGSDHSLRTIESGIELARLLNAKVTGLFVSKRTYIPEVDEGPLPLAEQFLAKITERAKEAGVRAECVSILGDSPSDVIVDYARDKGCDMIIMGTRGRSNVGKFLLGSTAAAVIEGCEIPVLLVR